MEQALMAVCEQLKQYGFRRLLVLSGDNQWVDAQITAIQKVLFGDWITVSTLLPEGMAPEKAHLLLGQEFTHGIFDARIGLHSEALAMLAGTLKAGSLLVLCTPPQAIWPQQEDHDSLRWNEQNGIIATPNFIAHLQQSIHQASDTLIYQQGEPVNFELLTYGEPWFPPTNEPTSQQQNILTRLLSSENNNHDRNVWGIIAPRGRGKSTVAGMFIKQLQEECWCCAPAKVATEVLEHHAGKPLTFWAPDALLQYLKQNQGIPVKWLIIDEAAAIPTYILRQLIDNVQNVLLTTTVDGYEGTGRGFMMKFCHGLENFTALALDEPIRFARNDPLENWLNQALLLREPDLNCVTTSQVKIQAINQSQLATDKHQLSAFYGLLTSAHYRTTPLDLRRLFDAQGQYFSVAQSAEINQPNNPQASYLGALWMVDEGGLSEALSWQIWAGLRRPRGNLVVQSLAAHGYFPTIPQMKSRRVMRIAVQSQYRREGLGLQLIEQQKQLAQQQALDFLSVSFGLTPELLAFWQAAGFQLMRIGSHHEASSGCFNAMAILPISEKAQQQAEKGRHLLQRDLFWRHDLELFSFDSSSQQDLLMEDWQELIGFSEYKRALAASTGAILRLLAQLKSIEIPEILSLYFVKQHSIEQICQQLGLTGQKQWLSKVREAVSSIISQQQPQLRQKINQQVISSYP